MILTLKISHPGIGAIISRIATSLSRITDYSHLKIEPVPVILRQLTHELGLIYDSQKTEDLLAERGYLS